MLVSQIAAGVCLIVWALFAYKDYKDDPPRYRSLSVSITMGLLELIATLLTIGAAVILGAIILGGVPLNV